MRTHLRTAVAAFALAAATALPAHAGDGNAATDVPDATVAIDAAFDAGLRGDALIDAATVAVNASGARPAAAGGARPATSASTRPTPARYGLWQLTADQLANHGHPSIADGYDPDIAAAVMAAETDQGTRWSAWSTHLREVNRDHIAGQVNQHLGGCAHDPAIADRAACRPDAGPIAHRAISFALTELGTPYSQCHSDWPACGAGGRFGRPDGGGHYDCSGLVHRAWHEAGYDLGEHDTTLRLMHATAPVGPLAHLAVADRYDPDVLRPGDVLVWNNDGIGHMGIWLDGNQVLHASSSRGVVIDDISDWWISRTQRILRAPGGG